MTSELEDEVRAYYERELLTDPFGNAGFEEDPDPPGELLMLWQVEGFRMLPWEGGLMDQPALLMDMLNICRNVRAEVEAVAKSQEGAKFDAHTILHGRSF
jgi:hypothetical protein